MSGLKHTKPMGTTVTTLSAEFAPEVDFEVRPHAVRSERQVEIARLEQLKLKLVAEWMRRTRNPETYSAIRQAANESVSLAWLSGLPLLMLPELLNEKVTTALNRLARQKQILLRSSQMLRAA